MDMGWVEHGMGWMNSTIEADSETSQGHGAHRFQKKALRPSPCSRVLPSRELAVAGGGEDVRLSGDASTFSGRRDIRGGVIGMSGKPK